MVTLAHSNFTDFVAKHKFIVVEFYAPWKRRPDLTRMIAFYSFLCGLFGGALGQNLFLKSLTSTSAMVVSAMINLVPAITFVKAIFLRLKRFGLNTSRQSKGIRNVIGHRWGNAPHILQRSRFESLAHQQKYAGNN